MATPSVQLVRKHREDSAAVKPRGSVGDRQQYLAAEFTSRLRVSMDRRGIRVFALTAASSYLTARGNDYGFDDIFKRLAHSLRRQGRAPVARAKEKEILAGGLLGGSGGVPAIYGCYQPSRAVQARENRILKR